MSKRPTVYDVAEKAGVSTATVSYAFGRPERVGASTLRRVMQVADELGYIPRSSARELAAGANNTFGLFAFEMLLEDGGQPGALDSDYPPSPWVFPLYVDEVQRGFQLECSRMKKSSLVGSGRSGDDGEILNVAGRVDGLALLPGEASDRAIEVVAQHMPVVLFSRPPLGDNTYAVTVDNRRGLDMLVGHLVDVHGLTEVGFVGAPGSGEVRERFSAFREAMEARGLPVADLPWAEVDVARVGYQERLSSQLSNRDLPQALVCGQDQIAGAVAKILQSGGHRIPDDVALVGFDGILAGQTMAPPLTTVRQPMEEMGRKAVQILAGNIDPAGGRTAVFEPRLIVRESCGCVPAREE